MSSIAEYQNGSHVLSHDTREPGSVEMQYASKDFVPSSVVSEHTFPKLSRETAASKKLPKISSHTSSIGMKRAPNSQQYLRAHDRLYLEGKEQHRYGKIHELLSEVASSINENTTIPDIVAEQSGLGKNGIFHPGVSDGRAKAAKDKFTTAGPTFFEQKPLKKPRKLPVSELVALKREISYSKLSIEMKKESMEKLKKYLSVQEEELQTQIELEKESRVLLHSYIKTLIADFSEVKGKQVKLEEQKNSLGEIITQTRAELTDADSELRRLNDEINEIRKFENFVESIAYVSYPEKVDEIKTHNKMVSEASSVELTQMEKQLNSSNRLKATATFMKRGSRANRSNSRVFANDPNFKGEKDSQGLFLTSQGAGNNLPTGVHAEPNDSQRRRSKRKSSVIDIQVIKPEGNQLSPQSPESGLPSPQIPEEKRYYLELYPSPEDFFIALKRIEKECLDSFSRINELDDDIVVNEKAAEGFLNHHKAELDVVKSNMRQLKETEDELIKQLDKKKAVLKVCSEEASCQPSFSEKELRIIFEKIITISEELGIMERKGRTAKDFSFDEIIDFLKDLTFLFASLDKAADKFKQEDKKGFDNEVRRQNAIKRDNMRAQQEIELIMEGKLKEEAKAKREAEIRRKAKGRRPKERHWVEEQENSGESLQNYSEDAEKKYWKMDD